MKTPNLHVSSVCVHLMKASPIFSFLFSLFGLDRDSGGSEPKQLDSIHKTKKKKKDTKKKLSRAEVNCRVEY